MKDFFNIMLLCIIIGAPIFALTGIYDVLNKLDHQEKILRQIHVMDCSSAIRDWHRRGVGEQVKIEE